MSCRISIDLYGSQSITFIPAFCKLAFAFFKARVIGGWGRTILCTQLAEVLLEVVEYLPITPHDADSYVSRILDSFPREWKKADFGIPWLLVEDGFHHEVDIINA